MVGSLLSDFNTGSFSYNIQKEQTIELHSDCTSVQFARAPSSLPSFLARLTISRTADYPKISFHTLLPALATALTPKVVEPAPVHAGLAYAIPDAPMNEVVKQEAFWPLWGKFFQENDSASFFPVRSGFEPTLMLLASKSSWSRRGPRRLE